MQSAASKRLLSTLASKLHPQLPLTPRESQQLLTLLTTSFRAHLDREHPLPMSARVQNPAGSNGQHQASVIQAPPSAYASTTRHIDSILTNPLFAVKPARRASETAAVDVLRDPMRWFVGQIASGSADLPKVAMCLELLELAPYTASGPQNGKSPALVFSEWLRNCGSDKSREFVELRSAKGGFDGKSLDRLIALLFAEEQTAAPWRWFIRSQELRVNETKLPVQKVSKFRQTLFYKMVTQGSKSLDEGLVMFMQAFCMAEVEGFESNYVALRPTGAHLVNRIISADSSAIDPDVYQLFLRSSPRWLGNWSQAVEAMLWLHHPKQSTTLPALSYIKDPSGALSYVNASKSRRHFLVQLCLGVARKSLDDEKYADAQVAMEFTKSHFADLVLSKPQTPEPQAAARHRARKEKENLDLLDSLAPV
ncbi:hypothetical protein EK21DRAFT_108833 [Setomelanomma holmii]|uniref:Uncharacterized protein n=1 Tax=Setomelanomma holmii TaxID=210430 RepID=A0A9P4LQY2_9PLEO|nr:hypothetical protein EK21DRAFT_108833 [Setomelanomma holmii]